MADLSSSIVVGIAGKRYSVFLRPRANGAGYYATRVSVWMPGAYNRAGHWRSVDTLGPIGVLATHAAVEKVGAEQ